MRFNITLAAKRKCLGWYGLYVLAISYIVNEIILITFYRLLARWWRELLNDLLFLKYFLRM